MSWCCYSICLVLTKLNDVSSWLMYLFRGMMNDDDEFGLTKLNVSWNLLLRSSPVAELAMIIFRECLIWFCGSIWLSWWYSFVGWRIRARRSIVKVQWFRDWSVFVKRKLWLFGVKDRNKRISFTPLHYIHVSSTRHIQPSYYMIVSYSPLPLPRYIHHQSMPSTLPYYF